MKISSIEYQLQIRKARKTLQELKKRLNQIETLLKSDPQNTSHRREMKKICLDITITENELEHAMANVDKKDLPIINDEAQNWTA